MTLIISVKTYKKFGLEAKIGVGPLVCLIYIHNVNYTAWFDHPGLLNLGHFWPLFFMEWRIFKKSNTSSYSSAHRAGFTSHKPLLHTHDTRQLTTSCYLLTLRARDNSTLYLVHERAVWPEGGNFPVLWDFWPKRGDRFLRMGNCGINSKRGGF